MPPVPCTHVRKRDGRLVAFELAKLSASIEAAARACGCENGFYSRELAEAVMLHLAYTTHGEPPDTARVAAVVEEVLEGLKYHRVARAYREYRLQREAQRERCTVIKPVQPSLLSGDLASQVTVMHSGHSSAWDRARIVQALQKEAHLGRVVAEEIARSVEEKLLASDLRRVTTTLIRALTDNELLVRGYTSALHQRSAVTVPFRDLDELLATAPETLITQVGREVARCYALGRIYSDDVADAHRRGVIDIGGLEHPLSQHRAHVMLRSGIELATQAEEIYAYTQRVATGCVTHVLLSIPEEAGPEWIAQTVTAWGAAMQSWGTSTRVASVLTREQIGACAEAWENMTAMPACELWCCGATADPRSLAGAIATLHARGWTVAWHPRAAPSAAAQLITINVPQAVYRARQHDLDGVIEELYRSVDMAAHAHRQFRQFLRAHGRADATQPGVLTCLGLDEAVAVLTGAGMFDSSDAMKCVRVVLSVLHDAAAGVARALELPLQMRLDELAGCGQRLARIDQALFPELFGFLPLQADALAHVVPPYRSLQVPLRGQSVAATVATCQHLLRYAPESVVRLDAAGLARADVLAHMQGLVGAECGFMMVGAAP